VKTNFSPEPGPGANKRPPGPGRRSTRAKKVDYALAYARHGFRVFPLHWIDGRGECSCGKAGCSSAGKHPIRMNWQQTATSDAAAIRALWRRNPDANIGVRCGENITVLDVDGDLGRSTLRDLELEKGELPETPIALTGSGGCHYYFAFEPSLGNAVRFAPGLDVRTEGGLVVGVGSQNRNGPYRWEAIAELSDTLKPAKMPAWLAELIAGAQPQTGPNGHFVLPSAPIAAGEGRNKTLYSLGRSLKARNLPVSHPGSFDGDQQGSVSAAPGWSGVGCADLSGHSRERPIGIQSTSDLAEWAGGVGMARPRGT